MQNIDIRTLKTEEIYRMIERLQDEVDHRPSFYYTMNAILNKHKGDFVILDALIKEDGKTFVRANLSDETWINKIVLKIFNEHIKSSSKYDTVEKFRDAIVNYTLTEYELTDIQLSDGCPWFNTEYENEGEENKQLTFKTYIYSVHTNKCFCSEDASRFWEV